VALFENSGYTKMTCLMRNMHKAWSFGVPQTSYRQYNPHEVQRIWFVQRYVHSSACFPTIHISATSGLTIYVYIYICVDVHMEYEPDIDLSGIFMVH
jgi:hypothetical protein